MHGMLHVCCRHVCRNACRMDAAHCMLRVSSGLAAWHRIVAASVEHDSGIGAGMLFDSQPQPLAKAPVAACIQHVKIGGGIPSPVTLHLRSHVCMVRMDAWSGSHESCIYGVCVLHLWRVRVAFMLRVRSMYVAHGCMAFDVCCTCCHGISHQCCTLHVACCM